MKWRKNKYLKMCFYLKFSFFFQTFFVQDWEILILFSKCLIKNLIIAKSKFLTKKNGENPKNYPIKPKKVYIFALFLFVFAIFLVLKSNIKQFFSFSDPRASEKKRAPQTEV